MGNQNRGKARPAIRPRPAKPSSDPAAEQTLDPHIGEVLDYHISGGTPVPPAETFTSGSGQTVASGNVIPSPRTGRQPSCAAESPPSDPAAIPLAADD